MRLTVKTPGACPVSEAVGSVEAMLTIGMMVVTAVPVLLVRFGSLVAETTEALLVILPATIVVATIVMVALEVFVIAPSSQVMVPPLFVQLPRLLVAETKLRLAGSVSLRTTPEAADGPRFVSVSV